MVAGSQEGGALGLSVSVSTAPAATAHLSRLAAPGRRGAAPHPYALVAFAALFLSALSLLSPSAPAYDPWAWIIWGREIVHLQLHTVGGPTWKPLPVMFTTLLAPFGSAAPMLWLLVARAGGLMAVGMGALLAFRISARQGASAPASVFAALVVLVGLPAIPGFAGSVLSGESEGLLAACAFLAIAAHMDGRSRSALWWGFAAALIRPEAWIFFCAYGLYAWRRDRGLPRLIVWQLVAIPALWFLPELLGSGSLTRGVHWAQFPKAGSPARAGCPFCAELTGHAWPMLASPFKVGAVLAGALVLVHGHGRMELLGLLAIGLAWLLEEAVFTQLGFSGSDRYLLAPVALLTVAGGVGWALALATRRWRLCGLAVAAAVLLGVAGPWPGPHLGRAVDQVGYQARLAGELRGAVQAAGGTRRLLACGPLQTNPSEVPLVAWTLNARLRAAESSSGRVVIVSPNGPHAPALPRVGRGYEVRARSGAVTVLSRCAG